MSNLVLHVKNEYFQDMRAGIKHFEYRLRNEYWTKRLEGRAYNGLVICNGYPKRDDHENKLFLRYLGYKFQTITHRHFGDEPVDVYAIIVSLPT